MIGMHVTGLNEWIASLKNANQKMPEVMKKTMQDAAEEAYVEAIRLCPEDSEELVESIYYESDENGFELGATAKHAVFNEYGCYNLDMGAAKYKGQRPFLRPAMYKVIDKVPQHFSKNWKRTLHG